MPSRPFARLTTTALLAGLLAAPCLPVFAGTLDDAATAAEAGHYLEAVRLYDQALVEDPTLGEDADYRTARTQAESAVAYQTGVLLHREGEYEAAIEAFIQAIGIDNDNQAALAALSDAQFAAARSRFDAAIAAADGGDLLTARDHLRNARNLGGVNASIDTALQSITDPAQAFEQDTLDRLAEAQRIANDLQWGLAENQFAALVEAQPLLLPARAGLHQAMHFKQRSMDLTTQGEDDLANERLGPAAEAFAGAAAIWPYNPTAGKLLEEVELRMAKAVELTDQARAQLDAGELQAAYETAQQARQQDLSSGPAQDVLRDATRLLAEDYAEQGMAELADENFDASRDLFVQSFEVSRGSRAARMGMTAWHLTLAALAEDGDREGIALLHYLAANEYGIEVTEEQSNAAESAILRESAASYRLRVGGGNADLGVGAGELASAIAGRDTAPWLSAAVGEDVPQYLVSVQITATDINLRRIQNTAVVDHTFGGFSGGFAGYEKRGTLDCDIAISDPTTGDIIERWQASRWTSHRDRRQYIIGQTWQESYFTLPDDDEIEAQLSRAVAREVWPRLQSVMTRHRATRLAAEAEALGEAGEQDAALDKLVAAHVLMGQVERREALGELRDLMRQHAQPAGPAAE